MKTFMKWIVPLSIMAALSSCAVGPNYKRPAAPQPPQFRGADQGATGTSLADLKWSETIKDPALQQLVTEALEKNFDLQIAAVRVLEARSQLGISRSNLLPTIDARGQYIANRGSSVGSFVFIRPGTNLDVAYSQVGFGLNWELDVWGRIRRLNEA
ncbi:MAG: TolC family protein, partial [Acidobacteriota bacterium]